MLAIGFEGGPSMAKKPAITVSPTQIALGIGANSLIQIVVQGWNKNRTTAIAGVRPGLQPLVPRWDNDHAGTVAFELRTTSEPGEKPKVVFPIPRGGEAPFQQQQDWQPPLEIILDIVQEVPGRDAKRGLVGVRLTLPLEGRQTTVELSEATISGANGTLGRCQIDPLTGFWRARIEFAVT